MTTQNTKDQQTNKPSALGIFLLIIAALVIFNTPIRELTGIDIIGGIRSLFSDDGEETRLREESDGIAFKPQQNTAAVPTQDPRFDGIPQELQGNYFLQSKARGGCREYRGDVLVMVVMVSDSVSAWDATAEQQLRQSLEGYTQQIAQEAAVYGTYLSFQLTYCSAGVDGQIADSSYSYDWQAQALQSAQLPPLGNLNRELADLYCTDEAAVVFAFNDDSRDYAHHGDGGEYVVLFGDGDFSAFRHEMFHLFGARDLYYPGEVKELAEQYLPDSVMGRGECVDALTAYVIGWTDSLSEPAQRFLEETDYVTHELVAQAQAAETVTGYGTKEYETGVYTGDLVRGSRHGQGTMQYNSGAWYTGDWDYGAWSGTGSGKWIYDDGSVYEGCWYNGERSGYGVMYYADGGCYEGNWLGGKVDGSGKYTWTNGSVYEGDWVYGVRTGYGTMYFYNGDVYTGQWLNNQRSGQGTYTWADGSSRTGTWQDGQFVK